MSCLLSTSGIMFDPSTSPINYRPKPRYTIKIVSFSFNSFSFLLDLPTGVFMEAHKYQKKISKCNDNYISVIQPEFYHPSLPIILPVQWG